MSDRHIRFNAFDMNCVGHQSPGLWAHPRDRSWRYKDLEYWQDPARTLERGVFDGFNLTYAVTPETFEDSVNLLAPELQKRGVYPKSYRPGTLREKLFGRGPHLPDTHPAHAYRDIEAVRARAAAGLRAAE